MDTPSVTSIPSEFQLGGFTWKVKKCKTLKDKWGHCDLAKREIVLLGTLQSDVLEQTFYHELTHAILIAMGKHTDDHSEEWIDAFSMFLHQYVKTAK